ncbi:unnamed protein product, partial [Mesorhabditis belari]|uniref:Short-chain dehydrogenase n=1 Tax=Mesorhabditis belari TaxID=2138241 RepID=A0AAF3FFF1_9BILA
MWPRSILITGASRGIGLGLVKEFLARSEVEHVFAGVRDPNRAPNLASISDPRLKVIALDILSDQSIEGAVEEISKVVGEKGLNVLVNNAAIMVQYHFHESPNRAKIDEVMRSNVTAPIIVTHYFLPLLRKALPRDANFLPSHAAIINIGSDYGSLTKCSVYGSGGELGHLPHKVSKAGLSQFSRVLSEDLKAEKLLVVTLHPGWVSTDMGTDAADISVGESVGALASTIELLNETHHGGFFDRNGEPLPL